MSELAGKKILLVDDDRDILAAMQTALSDQGCEVAVAGDGNDVIAQAEQAAPDLVVLDMMLPKKSGFLVMERLRKLPNRPKVIMITGNQGSRHKAYAESQGVNVYLNKPFRMERLLEAVRKLIA